MSAKIQHIQHNSEKLEYTYPIVAKQQNLISLTKTLQAVQKAEKYQFLFMKAQTFDRWKNN